MSEEVSTKKKRKPRVEKKENGNEMRKTAFSVPKRRRTVKRKPGQTSVVYFGKDAQDAISEFQKLDDPAEKMALYTKRIHPAFDSLVENLINVYGFKVMHEEKNGLKCECVDFLNTVMNKFDPTRGFKAFSYFNICAKNWLTIKSKQNVKKMKMMVSIDDTESDALSEHDNEIMSLHNKVPSCEEELIKHQGPNMLKEVLAVMREKSKTEHEIICLDALDQIAENVDEIDFFNRRAILIYLRNISGLSSKHISAAMNLMRKRYLEVKREIENKHKDEWQLRDEGLIKDPEPEFVDGDGNPIDISTLEPEELQNLIVAQQQLQQLVAAQQLSM